MDKDGRLTEKSVNTKQLEQVQHPSENNWNQLAVPDQSGYGGSQQGLLPHSSHGKADTASEQAATIRLPHALAENAPRPAQVAGTKMGIWVACEAAISAVVPFLLGTPRPQRRGHLQLRVCCEASAGLWCCFCCCLCCCSSLLSACCPQTDVFTTLRE